MIISKNQLTCKCKRERRFIVASVDAILDLDTESKDKVVVMQQEQNRKSVSP